MAVLVYASFTGADGVDVSAYTPDISAGSGFSDSGANQTEIIGNQVKFSASATGFWIDSGATDHYVHTTFNAGGADNRVTVHARRDNAAVSSRTCYEANFRFGINEIYIFKQVGGVSTQLGATISTAIGQSTTYKLGIRVTGTTIEALIDDVVIGTRTDSSITTGTRGGVAHFQWITAAARADNFYIESIGGAAIITPSGIASAEAHGTPVLSLGPVSLLPAAIPSAESVGTLTATPGAVGLAPSAIISAEAMGAAMVGIGPVSILVSGITTAEEFGLPALVGAGVIQPSSIQSGESLGVLVVQPGAVSLSPSAISSAEVIGAHVVQLVTGGAVTLYPAGIASAEQAGLPGLSVGAVSLQPAAIASGEVIGAPVITSATVLLPAGIASVEAIGNAVVLRGATIIMPAGITSLEQVGVLTIIGGVNVIGYLEALIITQPALRGSVSARPVLTAEVSVNVH